MGTAPRHPLAVSPHWWDAASPMLLRYFDVLQLLLWGVKSADIWEWESCLLPIITGMRSRRDVQNKSGFE